MLTFKDQLSWPIDLRDPEAAGFLALDGRDGVGGALILAPQEA